VQNLPKDYTEEEMKKLFEPFGKILSLKVKNKDSNSIGFVTFENSEHAQKAIYKLNEKYVGENFIFVQKHFSKKELEYQMKNGNSQARSVLNH